MNQRKMAFDPGQYVKLLPGLVGIVLNKAQYLAATKLLKQGQKPGRYFAPGCCQHPDYVIQIPVLFEDETFDVMRAMNIKRIDSPPPKKRQKLRTIIEKLDQYSRREQTMEDCIFCKIVKGEIPCFKVYEDDKVLAFEDINPIDLGHTLIIPKNHAENLFEIPDEDLAAIHLAAKKIAMGIREALNPTGIACLQLNGKGANQVVMHYHFHLVPRHEGAPELPITSWELKPGDMGAIEETAKKIAAAIEG